MTNADKDYIFKAATLPENFLLKFQKEQSWPTTVRLANGQEFYVANYMALHNFTKEICTYYSRYGKKHPITRT